MMTRHPAMLGGTPLFSEEIPIAKPALSKYTTQRFLETLKAVLDSGQVTNHTHVSELETKISSLLRVKSAVAMSSCTSGLALAMQLLGLAGKELLLPTFTFAATVHAAYWNKCRIVFVDSDPVTFNISSQDLERKISSRTAGIVAVHIFGNPCEVDVLEKIAREHHLNLIFDAAHGLGASYKGKKIGSFGDAEVFSCSPTKILTTLEGGILSTNNAILAQELKVARNYGVYPDYTCSVPGLSARMTEIGAALGLEMLVDIDEMVENRNIYARRYRANLEAVRGLSFQEVTPGGVHGYKDFAMVVNADDFGMDRDVLALALAREGVATKKYFSPLCHELKPYRGIAQDDLPNARFLSRGVLCLPMYSYMDNALIDNICLAIMRIQKYGEEIAGLKSKRRSANNVSVGAS